MSRVRGYTHKEEVANTLSHGLGILLGAFAGYILLSKAMASGDMWAVGSVMTYLFGMLASYITSSVYHGSINEKRKKLLQKFDHAAIYLHIAGTYTPFTLISLRESGAWGWSLFIFIWLSAIVGVYMSFREMDKHSHIETVCYVVMGCSILVAIKPLLDVLSLAGHESALYWLIGGGLSYIVGALFYSWTKKKYMHTVFHLLVLGGSICHIIAIYIIL
ncbi:MAG: hemolysin III family protein [Dysgonomonas sp.]